MQTIAAVKFALYAKINDKKIHQHDRKSGSGFFTVNTNAFSLLIAYPTLAWPVQLFQVIKISGLNCIALFAMKATKGSTRFVLNFFIKQGFTSKKAQGSASKHCN